MTEEQEEYEVWLQRRCRIMLQDFLIEALDAEITLKSTLREADDFVDHFMKKHNLS